MPKDSEFLDKNYPVKYLKHFSEDPMRNRALVEIHGRQFQLAGTGYKGPTFFIRAWEGTIEVAASKRCLALIRKLQRIVAKNQKT